VYLVLVFFVYILLNKRSGIHLPNITIQWASW